MLLVLDNCEHLVEACAQLAHAFVRECPQVSVLATSREALKVVGEVVFQVPPLTSPDPQHLPSIKVLTQYDAVRLFIERARAVLPSFEVDNANAPAVAQLCHHLNGVPLQRLPAVEHLDQTTPRRLGQHDRRRGSRAAHPG